MEPAVQFLLVLVQRIESAVKAHGPQVIHIQALGSTLPHYRPIHLPQKVCLSLESSRSTSRQERRAQAMNFAEIGLRPAGALIHMLTIRERE